MGTEIPKLRGVTEVHGHSYWEPQISQRETSQEWSEKVRVELHDLSSNFS